MQKDLCATTYRNGTPLTKQVELGKGAGYFKPEKDEIYFYNGEAILAGNLAPEGWKIPNNGNWDSLRQYIKNDISTQVMSVCIDYPCILEIVRFPVKDKSETLSSLKCYPVKDATKI